MNCECCNKELTSNKVVWLELSQTDNRYYEEIPEGHISQGAFPFGASCAKKILKAKNQGDVLLDNSKYL